MQKLKQSRVFQLRVALHVLAMVLINFFELSLLDMPSAGSVGEVCSGEGVEWRTRQSQ